MADPKKPLPPKKEEAKKNERIAKVVKKVLRDERPYPDKPKGKK